MVRWLYTTLYLHRLLATRMGVRVVHGKGFVDIGPEGLHKAGSGTIGAWITTSRTGFRGYLLLQACSHMLTNPME